MPNVIEMPAFATLEWKPLDDMSSDEFFDFCQRNRDYRIERESTGEVVMNMPAGGDTGRMNSDPLLPGLELDLRPIWHPFAE